MNLSSDEIKNYYYRVFVRQPAEKEKTLSSLTYRLAGVLIDNLDFYEARKLPKRKKLSEILQASNQAILDSLAQLEDVGFIKRTSLYAQIVCADSNEIENRQKFYAEKFKSELKSRRFNDEFLLNFYYNITQEEYMYSLLISIVKNEATLVATYNYINNLPKSIDNSNILKEIISKIYTSLNDINHVFMDISEEKIFSILEDILNNSKLTQLPLNGMQLPTFIVYTNEEKLNKSN